MRYWHPVRPRITQLGCTSCGFTYTAVISQRQPFYQCPECEAFQARELWSSDAPRIVCYDHNGQFEEANHVV